jgi:hypothetical protein
MFYRGKIGSLIFYCTSHLIQRPSPQPGGIGVDLSEAPSAAGQPWQGGTSSWQFSSRSQATENGAYVIDYGWMTWFALLSALALASLFIFAFLFRPAEPGTDIVPYAILAMAIYMLPWLMFVEGAFTWYAVNKDGIDKHSAWSRRKFLRWDEVYSISFSPVNQWFVIKGSGGTVRLHMYLDGLDRFAKAVKGHVAPEYWPSAKEEIERLASSETTDKSKGQ